MNVIEFSGSRLIWNGIVISHSTMRDQLAAVRQMSPMPLTVLDTKGAPDCQTAIQLRDEVNESADCQHTGNCGLGTREAWKHAHGLTGSNWVE
ncbi:MAG: hypothetical protein KGN34_07765 [Sphingomonadales bacterium]|nr:hypothetical protein [Sphingomonadales bacterium]